MGVLSVIYQIVTRSRIIYYLLPIFPILFILILKIKRPGKRSNYKIVDRKGKVIPACKVNGRIYPAFGVERVQTYSKIAIRDNDVLLCGYPKTGCHWTYEILAMLLKGTTELTKLGKAAEGMLDLCPDLILDSMPSPRVLNTHYLFEELPHQVKEKRNKIVFTIRNPKDTVVSFYNHCKNLSFYEGYDGDFDDFFNLFMSGEVEYESYFDHTLAWDKEIKSPTTNQILLVNFEDMKAQAEECIRRIAKFLDIDVTDRFVRDIAEAASFKKMKSKRSNGIGKAIFRKGQVGDWRNWLTDEQSAAIDKVWQQRMTGCIYQPDYGSSS